jgi:hypothetical protein
MYVCLCVDVVTEGDDEEETEEDEEAQQTVDGDTQDTVVAPLKIPKKKGMTLHF